MDAYLIEEGCSDASLETSSGEVRAGMDLQELVREAKAFKAGVDRLATRAPAFTIEQGALSGLFDENGGDLLERALRTAERLNLYNEEGDGPWSGELAQQGGVAFSRVRRLL